MTTPNSVGGLARSLLIPQLVFLSIALLLTFTLTNSPRQTLLLKRPINWWTVPAAALLAIVLHPAVNWLQVLVLDLYKISPNVQPALEQMSQLLKKADWRLVLLLIAVTPALCEEIAFRGFVLSGLRHLGHKWRAVFFSALLFGFTHGILQQSIIASLVGMVIGFLAVQSGCLLPCMVYHVIHNALGVLGSRITPEQFPDWPMLWMFVTPGKDGGCEFGYPAFVAGSLAGLLLLIWFGRLPCPNSPEAVLEETIRSGETNGMSVKVPSPLGER
jgi:sodium transport system permease protein